MTAIFVYAARDVAFVAADTLRVDPINVLPRVRVCKVHHWSDLVIFGQTGTQHLSSLIMDIKLEKRQFIDPATGTVYFDDSENWFFQTLEKCRPLQTQAPAAASGKALSQGTLLAATLDSKGNPPRLVSYDFGSGARHVLADEFSADGTDATQFQQFATKHMSALKHAGASSVPLDQWAQMCLSDAISAYGGSVGWPCDLLISRPDKYGGRILVQRRIDDSSKCGDPLFAS